MDRWEREGLLSANSGMRNQLDHLLDAFERRHGPLTELYRQVEATRVQAISPDRSVEVTVDAGGVLTDLRLTTAAMRRDPEQLSQLIIDAVQTAARRAQQQTESLAAPVHDGLDDLGDYTDLSSEAPSLHEIRAFFRGDKKDLPA